MKKILTTYLIITSFVLSPVLRADDYSDYGDEPSEVVSEENPPEEPPEPQPEMATEPEELPEDSEGTPVGQAANEGTNTAKRRQWQNIAIASVAVALAITALILVANNDGHKGHHKHHD